MSLFHNKLQLTLFILTDFFIVLVKIEEIEKEILNLLKKTIELGGTLTGEHGIGLAKKRFLHLEFDKSTIKAMIDFKEIFDPTNLLNPDKIFQKNH